MSLRSLIFDVAFNGNASAVVQMDDATNELRETAMGATENIEGMDSATDELGRTTMGAGKVIEENWKKITLAAGATGLAIEKMARQQAELTTATRGLAVTTDMTEKEIRTMVGSLTDHTFATEDALAGMDRLQQSGYNTQSQFESLLPVFDTFADATGKDMVSGIDFFDRTLSALDIPLTEAEEHLDTMTWLITQTTVGMGEMGQLMRREAPTLRAMGLNVDEIAIAMAGLEAEGIRGPRAVSGFQNALKDAEGDIERFWKELGVSQEVLENQSERLLEAEGLTQALADANNSGDTAMQKLTSAAEQLAYQYGPLIELSSSLVPLLLAAGPAAKIASAAFAVLATPVGAVGGAVAVLGVGVWQLWRNWDAVTERSGDAMDWLLDKSDNVVNGTIDKFAELGSRASAYVNDMASDIIDSIMSYPPLQAVNEVWDETLAYLNGIDLREVGSDIVQGLINGITSMGSDAAQAARDVASGIGNSVKSFFGINSDSKLMIEYGGNIVGGLETGIDSSIPNTTKSMERMTDRALSGAVTNNSKMTFSPNVKIEVGNGTNARQAANELEREFNSLMDRYAKKLSLRNPALTEA
ncbi:phage tail tape measure protein, TP901 family [Alkaliphilus metalliredigens QYMF]|uniref:Phage tail tape measure protein, TP901 family n=1 Tax=Alkaliphilus metalliredigens (strain QYMF) TaxID=293826 RepID=A6TKE0_ALKMQ|nr:phage tail tape measure protein [Alkaliphilus metalliredigens]ABR46658.1 phage tail tape measure protein, TP901 family [Alkaliphilus metalliredigens QYMF]ABR48130.1 phage tail tape measure protein, TP901 family [Alkaliphilus metalliredigens QYMF]ABR50425.1 phage tail tape measure protein, TP901 family [Alkaliphilus metalliredigens QYMF]